MAMFLNDRVFWLHSIFAAMAAINGISVIIPNYNGEHLLPQILPHALVALQQNEWPFEIIVVDDGSTDGSVLMIKQNFPGIRIIENEKNVGFSATANKGIYAAMYTWVLLLNSDVKLEPGYFKPLMKYTSRQKILGVMGRVLGWDDDIIQDGAKYPHFQGVKIKTSGNYLLKKEEEMKDGLLTMYLSGSNAFMNKNAFKAIGGFEELFSPYYVEDFEISLRAWRMGLSCYFEYNAICRHQTSTTIAGSSKKKKIKTIYNRNKMYLHAIHLSLAQRVAWFFQLAGETIIRLVSFQWSYLHALSLFIKSYKQVKERRKRLLENTDDKLLTIKEVANKILVSIQGKEITRF